MVTNEVDMTPNLPRQTPACREFYAKYFDDRCYLQCFVRWVANEGPDDAFENFNGWPELKRNVLRAKF